MGTKTKRAVSLLLVMVMIVTTLPVSVLHTNAADTSNLPVLDSIYEYNAKSSTAIKNITNMVNASSNAAQYTALLKRAGGYATLLGGSIDAIRGAVYSYDNNDEWYENIWNIGSGAVAGFLGLNSSTSSNPPIQYDLDEMKSMIQDMDQDVQEIKGKLDNLEEVVQTNFDDLSNIIINIINEAEYKQALNEFTGDFDYYISFKPDLNVKYAALLEELKGSNEKGIKQAYDDLYMAAEKSTELYGYITGENKSLAGKQTIQGILYKYSMQSSVEDFELKCIAFAEDLYSTYIFAQYCLLLCYNYQMLYAQTDKDSDYYYIQVNKTDIKSILYAFISSKYINKILENQNTVNKCIAKYLCEVLRLNGEFNYTSRNIRFGTVPYSEIYTNNIAGSVAYTSSSGSTIYYRINNNLQKGDIIQICEMPDEYMEMFNHQGFDISVSNSNATLSNGIVQVMGSSGSFDVIYSYDGMECYRVSFNIVSKYSGGLGIEEAPYLISTPSDFSSLRTAQVPSYYLLINDINYSGSQLPSINIANVGFGGILDGGGYKVYNYKITASGNDDGDYTQFNYSLFPIIKSNAVIKNLTIGNLDCATYNGHSVLYEVNDGRPGYSVTVYNGVLSGINEGTIANCNIQNVRVYAQFKMPQNVSVRYDWSLDAFVGGFAALNNGTIAHSLISNSELIGQYQSFQNHCRLFMGGIAGTNMGNVANCFSLYNDFVAETTATSYIQSTQSIIHSGNIIGLPYIGSVSQVYGRACSIIMRPSGSHEKSAYKGVDVSSLPNVGPPDFMEYHGWMNRGDDLAIIDYNLAKEMCDFVLPHKTIYYVGDELNLTGMELYYGNIISPDLLGINNKVMAYNYKISGFDSSKTGTQTVTITYNDLSVSFDVTILCQHKWDNGVLNDDKSFVTYSCEYCDEVRNEKIPTIECYTYFDCEYEVSGRVVTVSSDAACKVGYLSGGAYIALDALPNADGSYSFTAPEGVSEVLLVLKGDANLDGRVTAADIARINAHKLGKTAIGAEAIFAGDVDRNNVLNDSDIDTIKAAVLRRSELNW